MNNDQIIGHQRQSHPLVPTEHFASVEAYCSYLVHLKAYETAAQLARGKDVLDCGCNVGYGTALIGCEASRVTGADISDRAVTDARARYPDLDFRVVDGRELPFDDDSFDLVVSFQVIEHVGDYGPYLGEIRRVLRPGGQALFTTPNSIIRVPPGMKPWYKFHVREFSPSELAETLRGHFDDVEIRGMFGSGRVYEMELARNLRAREAHRRWRGMLPTIRRLVPVGLVRSLRSRPSASAPTDADLVGLSTEELFYRTDDLDDCLDLLGVCRT